MGSVSAASEDMIYVNGSSGNDSWDGLTPETAKLTIKNATGSVNTGGSVFIASGTYSGTGNSNIVIDHNMTVIGAGKNKTIITGLDTSRIFTVNSGVTFYLKSLTITNGKSGYGGGVYLKASHMWMTVYSQSAQHITSTYVVVQQFAAGKGAH